MILPARTRVTWSFNRPKVLQKKKITSADGNDVVHGFSIVADCTTLLVRSKVRIKCLGDNTNHDKRKC